MKKLFLLLLMAGTISWSYAQDFDGVVYDATCNGSVDGQIDITMISEPTGFFEFNWSNGEHTEDISGLTPGNYTLTVTDIMAKSMNSITSEQTFTVLEPPAITITVVSQISPSCPGDADGEINISVSTGVAPYEYSWTALFDQMFFETTENVSGLASDTYIVQVIDNNGCVQQENIALADPEYMEIEITPIDESCYGANDAGVDLNVVSGGASPYTYLWSTGATSQNLSGLFIDPTMGYEEFWVTITDANGCTEMTGTMVNAQYEPEYEIYTINSNCGNSDGEAMILGLDGNFEITWVTGEITDHIYSLHAGLYTVEINNIDMGCSSIQEFYIEDNTDAVITPTVLDATSPSTNDGQITLNITGGNPPHIVVWDNAMLGNINPNLYAGSYSATITDANGCLNTTCVGVGYISELSSSVSSTNTNSCSGINGSATVSPSDGIPPYVFIWDDPNTQSTAMASNLTAGIYHCVITDASLTQITVTVAVGDNGGANVSFIEDGIETCGQSDGYININATGGTGTLSYLWSNGSTSQNLTNVAEGYYQLLVTDQGFPACYTSFSGYVQGTVPMEQPICIVTVDSATNHNLVVWENIQTDGVDHYNIYRDNCDNGFGLIGSVNADAITVFEDLNSLPFIQSYAYKISAVDACGNESMLSPMHKTIHLEINLNEGTQEAQLIWDDYMGFPNPVFKLYKKVIDLGWILLAEVQNTEYSFIDIEYNDTTISYAILVEHPDGVDACDAWNGNSKASGGPYYQSTSNIEDEGIINHTQLDNLDSQLSIYPNPTNRVLNINNSDIINSVKLFDISGKLIISYQNINKNEIRLNTQNFEPGIYILEIHSTEITKERIVIE